MEALSALGSWIAANESLLSGLVALVVLTGVVLSPLGSGLRRALGRGGDASAASLARGGAPRRLTLEDLTRTSPREIRFADAGGVRVAYSEQGEGPPDLLVSPGIVSHQHLMANLPTTRDMLGALSRFARVVSFDKRGQGLSDPVLRAPTVEERGADIEAVLDAAGLERAFLLGISESGPICLHFAHAHPERVQGLVLLGTCATWVQREDFPIGIPRATLENGARNWGRGLSRHVFFPAISTDVIDDDTYRAFERMIASRESMAQIVEMMLETDVRPLLPEIEVPALVIHFSGDLAIPPRMGRAMAEGLPHAEFLEVSGVNHVDLARSPEAVARVESFCREILARG